MWFGTEDGLNKYDGYRFVTYKHDPLDSTSLSNNRVRTIYEDRAGLLWIGTQGGGVNIFDREKESFRVHKNDPRNPNSLCNNRVWAISEDREGVLWIGTEGGLCRMNRLRTPSEDERGIESFTIYKHKPDDPNGLRHDFVTSICEDSGGLLWVGTSGGGLNGFDREKESFTVFKIGSDNTNSTGIHNIRSAHQDRSGTLWVGTEDGLVRVTHNHTPSKDARATRNFNVFRHNHDNPYSVSDNNIRSVCGDRSGQIWIGTDDGLNAYVGDQGMFKLYHHEPDNPRSMSHERVWSIYEDEAGVMWIGTFGGLNTFDRRKKRFTAYRHEPNNPNRMSHNYVYAIYEDESGVVWIGTFGGGLNRFDRETGRFTVYKHEPFDPQSLSHNSVFSIYEDSAGEMWVGTYDGGLNRFDREKETFIHYTEKDGLPNSVVYGILEDDRGSLWLSINRGLSKFRPDAPFGTSTTSSPIFINYDMSDGLQSNEFNFGAYYKNRNGEIYFGGINGLNLFHPDSIKENPYVPPIVVTDFNIKTIVKNQSS